MSTPNLNLPVLSCRLVCGAFYVITGIMEEGRRLAVENSEFI